MIRPAVPPELNELDAALARAAAPRTGCSATVRWRGYGLALLFTAAVAVIAAVAAFAGGSYAYRQSEAHTDRRIAVLEGDLSSRRAVAGRQNASRDQQIAELRRLVCLFADRVRPRDASIEQVRATYGCTGDGSPTPR